MYRIITKIEEIFIKSSAFRLPGKKQLLKSSTEISVVVVDVTENPIERPKKNRKNITVEKAMQRGLGGFPAARSADRRLTTTGGRMSAQRLHQERKSIP